MTLSIEYLVRNEAGKLLRDRFPGRFYTKAQIERALQTVSKTPVALMYKHAFVCDQCGKTAPCLGVK